MKGYIRTGNKPSIPVREEGGSKLHQQAQDAALRPLLRPPLPRRGDLERATTCLQGAGRERRRMEASLLQALGGRRCEAGLGHRCHL